MRYYIIAGEASGDMHAANLMTALKKLDREASFRCWGGDRMKAAGGVLVRHYRDLAFMGFLEVLLHIRTILRNLSFCKKDILEDRPDAVILVDYPGFNLRIAKFAHQRGFRVIYYISPQIWAWNRSRVRLIRDYVDQMLVILPFEQDFYRDHGVKVEFPGHPLPDVIARPSAYASRKDFLDAHGLQDKQLIALLPGSRKQEISRMLPVMLSLVKLFPAYQFVIAGAPSMDPAVYKPAGDHANLPVLSDNTHELLRHAHAALVTSGTATLETALFEVPQVVCYSGSPFSYAIARKLVKVRYISLVNLIMDKPVVKELIQHDFHRENLEKELRLILEEENRGKIIEDYQALKELLGNEGASQRAAELIFHGMNPVPPAK